jgi:hypothetical protein
MFVLTRGRLAPPHQATTFLDCELPHVQNVRTPPDLRPGTRINGAAHIAQQIADSIPQDGRLVLHAGDDTHPAFVSIHIPVMSTTEGQRTYAQARAVYAELERRGFEHEGKHDFENPMDGIARTRYLHPVTGYELELVLYQESDPEAHPPFSADQVNEIRANFWQQLSGTGASS